MIGATISHYRILEKLGQGGMGEVYLAEDIELKRKVAIKFLPPHVAQDDEMLERFQREARATAALQHPNIVTIHEFGAHEGRRFIVMAFIDGDLLSERISRRDLDLPSVIEIAAALAAALAEAHGANIIHRDLKPDNIIIDKRGQPHVLDFGLAVQSGATRLTRDGSTVGTLHYMSPEQTSGEEIDERTDIFSLGAIVYEMVTGQKAFPGSNAAAIINKIVNEEPQPMTRYNTEVGEDFDRVVATALAKDRGVRFQTMRAFGEALNPFRQSGIASAVSSGVSRSTGIVKSPSSGGTRKRVIGVVAIVAVLAAAWIGYRSLNPQPQSEPAITTEAPRETLGQIRTLAVLPFTNNSKGSEEEYFADAMTVELINDLSRVSALTVFPASTVMGLKDSGESIPVIAERLGADAVITGSVWQDGGRVRVNVDLVPTGATERLWGESYESEFDDLLTLQSRLAREITGQVKVSVEPLEAAWLKQERSANPEAFKLYLKGLYYWNLMTREGFVKSDEMFKRSVALDPDFAPVYAELARIRMWDDETEEALDLVERALELDPNQVDALTILASIQIRDQWDWEGAHETIEKAKSLQPNNPQVHKVEGDLLLIAGHHREGLKEYQTAVALNPLSHPIACSLVGKYTATNEYARAIDYGLDVAVNFPGCPSEYQNVGESYMYLHQYDKALDYLQRSYDVQPTRSTRHSMACVYALSGQTDKAREMLHEFESDGASAYSLALLHAALGDDDEALDRLEKAYEERSGGIFWLRYEPLFENIRDNPRFIELMNKVKVPTG